MKYCDPPGYQGVGSSRASSFVVFAQDSLFLPGDNTDYPGENYDILSQAVKKPGVEVVGSAPYVEASIAQAKVNIRLLLELAWQRKLHVDFHLDYNVDPNSEPLVWYVLEELQTRLSTGRWRKDMLVTIGHATRLTLFTDEEWSRFRQTVEENHIPITLVGLPQSDMYMMGRTMEHPQRTTLDVPKLAKVHRIRVAMSVNNVDNAFTPQGSVDPLLLCPLAIALSQACTNTDCESILVSQ